MANYNKHAVYNIRALRRTGGTRWGLLIEVVTEHCQKFKNGVVLIAKTYGIRRLVSDESKIWPTCVFIMCSPFFILIAVMIFETKCQRKKEEPRVIVIDPRKKKKTD